MVIYLWCYRVNAVMAKCVQISLYLYVATLLILEEINQSYHALLYVYYLRLHPYACLVASIVSYLSHQTFYDKALEWYTTCLNGLLVCTCYIRDDVMYTSKISLLIVYSEASPNLFS